MALMLKKTPTPHYRVVPLKQKADQTQMAIQNSGHHQTSGLQENEIK